MKCYSHRHRFGNGHVGEGRHPRFPCEVNFKGCLQCGLVEAREGFAGVGGLELGRSRISGQRL